MACLSRVPLTLKLLLMLAVVGLMLNFFMIWTVGSNTMDGNQKRQGFNSPPLVSAETNSKPVVWINAKKITMISIVGANELLCYLFVYYLFRLLSDKVDLIDNIPYENLSELAMSHVHTVFDRLGYRLRLPGEAWDVMWSHGYPFNIFKEDLQNLHPHQRVNHFPGTSCFVSKPKLSTHGFSFTPKTYRLPEDVDQLLTQSKKYPEKLWIQKSNMHRGIRIIKPEAIELKYKGSIVQEYVEKPMLIDGRKFDVGIYVAIMSVNPLRVYAYGEEILWRFCPKPYHPFDENDKERYVIDDEYTPAWEIPMVRPLVQDSGLSHKEAFNYILKQKGFAPEKFWNTAHSIIQQVMYHCESAVVNYTKSYASINNFVEMVRFDFVTDENLNIWLMEVNLSPNLSSSHVANNRFMYEQLVFNFLSITGLARGPDQGLRYNGEYESIMFANEHDIQVPLLHCIDNSCANNCKHQLSCQLCKQCQHDKFIFTLKTAFLEHVNKRNFHRLIPPPRDGCHGNMLPPGTISRSHHSTRVNNYLMEEWFDGKCCQNQNWCS